MTHQDSLDAQPSFPGEPVPRTMTPGEMTIVRAGWLGLIAIAIAAVAIAVLAFGAWVDYGVAETNGQNVKALTGVSDGYFVVALSAVIFFAAVAVMSNPGWTLALLPLIAVSAVVVFTTACYGAISDWQAAGADEDGAFIVSGDPTVVPYLIAGLAVAIAVIASLLAAFRASRTR